MEWDGQGAHLWEEEGVVPVWVLAGKKHSEEVRERTARKALALLMLT